MTVSPLSRVGLMRCDVTSRGFPLISLFTLQAYRLRTHAPSPTLSPGRSLINHTRKRRCAWEPWPQSEGNNASAVSCPVMAGVGHSLAVGSDGQGHAIKRSATMAGLDSSPGSIDDVDDVDARDDKKRQPVKRACNECRQQKVSLSSCLHRSENSQADFLGAASVRCDPGPLRGVFEVSPSQTRL